ncbi:uncharacterized protein CC84DRAFT_654993 [Paraphaeosphaeria sporulosa]|uniref:Uncharacterized protein n=1 Tax=Paraphaeosphaeria sporulosa TaxID=1460663 RepID=A0A177CKF1_9PLEO|nr:uncharacterized protein CC84DRAFT_654993 [Paraphaeosphaeria sporulosa]OAG07319.1 hypothetical protein CC84DRAFT_654993 [Paraphaeosphaeria sporulosa]
MPAFLVFCPQIISRSRAQANAGSPDTTPAISRLPRYPKQAHPIRSIQGQDDWPHDDETMKCAKEIRGKNEPLEKEPGPANRPTHCWQSRISVPETHLC